MRKMKLFFTALAMLVASVAYAQSLTVSGNVTDATTGEPVPFAAVHVKGTMNGVSTDVNGQYSLSMVPKDGILVFSSIGYQNAEVPVNGMAVVNCDLKVDTETLESAVAVGYGSARKVGTMVGSVTTVQSEALATAPSASPLDQLQGQVAGLAVMTTGGIAGENNVSMTLHGTGSLGSSSTPLFIIDGIQSSSRAIMAMNPNDIASISILKDASATSIYGSRAANGVVFVTTKSGSYDAKASVTVRSQAGVSTLADMTLYENMFSGPELKEFWVRAGLMTPAQIKATYTDNGFDADTKWYNVLQQFNNPQFQNDVTVEGGGNKVAYMIGASQFHQRGTTIGNYFDRYTVRSNVQGHPKEWLKVGANLSLSYDARQTNGNWGGASSVSNYTSGGLSFLNNPLYPVINPETGEYYETKFPNGLMNPHYYMSNVPNLTQRYGLLAAFNVVIEPFKNFKISSRAGVDGSISYGTSYRKPTYISAPLNGARSRSNAIDYAATITNTIEYAFDIAEDHHFTVLAGQEGVSNRYDYIYAYSEGITDDRLINLQDGVQAKYDIEEQFTASKFLSFFGRVDYGFANKYYFDASVRNDACSRFGPNNRNATFWAVGGMWKMKNENFLRNAYWLNDLNFKVSYGTQGNASIGDYQHYALLSPSTNYAEGSSMVVGQPSNPGLTWEQQALLTVGFNGRIADRVDFNVEYYNRKTSSMLMEVPYNYTTGFSSLYDNVGGLLNQGIDLTLGVDILSGKDYWLRASTTFNFNDEKVTELFNGLDRWEMVGYGFAYVVGQPVSFYAPIFAGIDPADGMPMWYLPGEDVDVTTMKETTKVFDEAGLTQNTGKKLNSPIYGGFSIGGGWRGLSLQADFAYVLGKTLINNDMYFYANPNSFSGMNQHKTVADFWTPENTDAQWPDWSKGAIMQFDTHMYENADFLRLKNLQVAYDLPRRFLGNQQVINGVKVSFTGRNIFTVTKFSGIDPEVDSNLTYGRAGNSKQYLFGLEITF
ncbi:MAG: SusC/RagA family TonB-linked outer membrane protein [Bacteroidales bacterium]|nr:SusC/RagA family TonB-linked outer membrane protein [Bacteroidales bacterium]